jgi:hypothetical protein
VLKEITDLKRNWMHASQTPAVRERMAISKVPNAAAEDTACRQG